MAFDAVIGDESEEFTARFKAVRWPGFVPRRCGPKPRIAYAKRRVKPLARLLRCATALRVTAPLGCGSGVWYGRKVPFRPVHTARMPRFGAWCNAIERYQMRYKITG